MSIGILNFPIPTTTGGGGGGDPTIGNPVVGGSPNLVLYVDADGNLANNPSFGFNGTELNLGTLFSVGLAGNMAVEQITLQNQIIGISSSINYTMSGSATAINDAYEAASFFNSVPVFGGQSQGFSIWFDAYQSGSWIVSLVVGDSSGPHWQGGTSPFSTYNGQNGASGSSTLTGQYPLVIDNLGNITSPVIFADVSGQIFASNAVTSNIGRNISGANLNFGNDFGTGVNNGLGVFFSDSDGSFKFTNGTFTVGKWNGDGGLLARGIYYDPSSGDIILGDPDDLFTGNYVKIPGDGSNVQFHGYGIDVGGDSSFAGGLGFAGQLAAGDFLCPTLDTSYNGGAQIGGLSSGGAKIQINDNAQDIYEQCNTWTAGSAQVLGGTFLSVDNGSKNAQLTNGFFGINMVPERDLSINVTNNADSGIQFDRPTSGNLSSAGLWHSVGGLGNQQQWFWGLKQNDDNYYLRNQDSTDYITVDYSTGAAAFTGNLSVSVTGHGLRVKEGSNAKQGVATLVAGTVTVSNTSVTATSRIQLTAQSLGTVSIPSALAISARSVGTSFTILASAITDTSVVAYEIFEPA